VNRYRKGYRLGARQSGYLEGSVVPDSEDTVHHLVEYLDSLVPSSLVDVGDLYERKNYG